MKHFTFWVFLLFSLQVYGQKHYEIDWKEEAFILGGSAVMAGSSFLIDNQKDAYSISEVMDAVPSVNRFDRVALSYNSTGAKIGSDALFFLSSALPIGLLTSKHLKGERLGYLVMLSETVALNGGITYLVKSLTDKRRPYFYDGEVSMEERRSLDARKSFFSGHASHSAAMCFFSARVFSDLYPESKWKPLVWTSAAIVPAATAYLRVRAGRHFPTDVIVGYGVGAGIGLLIPYIHSKKRRKESALKLRSSMDGLSLVYGF